MRARTVVLVSLAVLLLASVTVGAAYTMRSSDASCRPNADGACQRSTDCTPERPACQEQQRNQRLRAACAEHPRDEKCRAR